MALILSGTLGLSDVDGNAATPAIRGTDTNTGIFFPAADQLAASVNGVEGLRLTSTGLGIGTSSPGAKLAVSGPAEVASFTGSSDSRVRIVAADTGVSRVGFDGTVQNRGFVDYAHSDNSMRFATAFAERARIDSSGNLGIGTSSPVSRLDVQTAASTNGGATFGVNGTMTGTVGTGGFSVNGGAITDFGIRAANNMLFATGSGAPLRMTLDASGNLGLGVTPSAWGSFVPKAIQLPKGIALASQSNANVGHLVANAFYDGAWKYVENAAASSFVVNNTGSSGFAWYTAPSGTAGNAISFTQAMTLDASGNLALKGTTVSTYFDGMTVGSGSTAVGYNVYMGSGTGGLNFMTGTSGGNRYDGFLQYTGSTQALTFGTAGIERARIGSSGILYVNKTSGFGSISTSGIELSSGYSMFSANNSGTNPTMFVGALGSSGYLISFYYGGASVGHITTNGTTTTYGTSSDYRLKENVQPMTGSLATVAQLKPCTYTWKSNGSVGQGFIAHELQAVCPDAVIGEKDAVNEDGSINPQGIDTSFLVATLTAAIQEQQAMIETLKADVAALKGQA